MGGPSGVFHLRRSSQSSSSPRRFVRLSVTLRITACSVRPTSSSPSHQLVSQPRDRPHPPTTSAVSILLTHRRPRYEEPRFRRESATDRKRCGTSTSIVIHLEALRLSQRTLPFQRGVDAIKHKMVYRGPETPMGIYYDTPEPGAPQLSRSQPHRPWFLSSDSYTL